MYKSRIFLALTIQILWIFILLVAVQKNTTQTLYAIELQQSATPQPFLGPIYYGQEDVWQVFDHQHPNSTLDNGFPWVMHFNGTQHHPVTNTPTLGPTLTPDLTQTPTPMPTYIPGGYGYSSHPLARRR